MKSASRKRSKRPWSQRKPSGIYAFHRVINNNGVSVANSRVFTPALDSRPVVAINPNWEADIKELREAGNEYHRIVGPILLARSASKSWTFKRSTLKPDPPWSRTLTSQSIGDIASAWRGYAYNAPSPTDLPLLESRARLAFLGKLKEVQTTFQSQVFLGELMETVRFLKNPFKGMAKETRNYVSRCRRQLLRGGQIRQGLTADYIARVLSNEYLSWTYGVSPLINDVKAYLEMLKRFSEDPHIVQIRVTIPEDPWFTSDHEHAIYEFTGALCSQRIAYSSSLRIIGAVEIVTDGPKAEINHALSLSGLTLNDFIPTVYELIPYSFLVDYFSTVGNVVGGLFTATDNLIWYWGILKSEARQLLTAIPLAPPAISGSRPKTSPSPLDLSFDLSLKKSIKRYKPSLQVTHRDLRLELPSLGQWFNTAVLGFATQRRLADH